MPVLPARAFRADMGLIARGLPVTVDFMLVAVFIAVHTTKGLHLADALYDTQLMCVIMQQ